MSEEKKEVKLTEISQKENQKIQTDLNEIMDMELINEIISDNTFPFEFKNNKYRVRRPTYEEKTDANKKRSAKYLELLKDESFAFEKELRVLYKKRGIDIDEMDKTIRNLNQKRENYALKLGEALAKKKPDAELQIFKDEIDKINLQTQPITIEKSSLLELSIENQVTIFVYTYLTFLISEKLVDKKWIRIWNSHIELLNDKTPLVNKITFYSTILINDELNLNKYE